MIGNNIKRTVIKDNDITIDLIKEVLDDIADKIKISNHFNFTDINVVSEDIFRQLLNLIYGYKLKWMSTYDSGNFVAVDLVDETNKVAYQVTTDFSHKKIEETLAKFESHGLGSSIDKLYVLILGNTNHRYNSTKDSPNKVTLSNKQEFDYNKDVINFDGLLESIKKVTPSNPEILAKAYDILTMVPDSGRLEYRDIVKDTKNKIMDERIEIYENIFLAKGLGDICIRAYIPSTYKGTLSCCIQFRKHDICGIDITLGQEELLRDYLVDEDIFCEKHITVRPDKKHMVMMRLNDLGFEINEHSAYNVYKCFRKIKKSYDEAMMHIRSDLGWTKFELEKGRFFSQEIACDQLEKIVDFSVNHNWGFENDDYEWNIFNDGCNYNQIILSPNLSSGKLGQILAMFKFEPIISYNNDIKGYKVYWVPGSYTEAKSSKFDNVTRWTADYSSEWFEQLLTKIDCMPRQEDDDFAKTRIWKKLKSLFKL